ncbi:MAG: hypothetical protein A2591_01185 [Candidatus Yonathbacteria bacterium RIFOXYD1_FULL_52_36]|uniref:Uncharacterized protein n=1 Tax=Candidatus Yonathbacteria bacterium RIFOXYD1_FULL_52_36 TaxID=1802730 RepID=A0A1G2SIL1_9BACT|nr:MAG: hypothetical protein A2591_01185 [Candidatus Yonathbacteria bacterium RIFOXYD1_FULL_52_36]
MKQKMSYTINIKEIPETSEVEVTGEIATDSFAVYEPGVVAYFAQTATLPGFRKGHVPEKIIRERMGDDTILHEMAERAIADAYPKIIQEKSLEPLGRPEVALTKVVRGNPLGFTIRFGVMPKFSLPDYKALAAKVPAEPVVAEEKEIDDALEELRKRVARFDQSKNGGSPTQEIPDELLPTLDDAFAEHVAGVKTLAELREKMRAGIIEEKNLRTRSTRRSKILDAILSATTIAVPPIVVAGETDVLLGELRTDIERLGITFSDYLKHAGKTEEELRKDVAPDAGKRARIQFILNAIAEKENILPDKAILESETARLMQAYPDAEKTRVMVHVGTKLVNEQTLKLLENAGA